MVGNMWLESCYTNIGSLSLTKEKGNARLIEANYRKSIFLFMKSTLLPFQVIEIQVTEIVK